MTVVQFPNNRKPVKRPKKTKRKPWKHGVGVAVMHTKLGAVIFKGSTVELGVFPGFFGIRREPIRGDKDADR